MADELSMNLESMASTVHVLANQADELQEELDSVTRAWNELSSTWTGVAASSFDPPWDEWHDGAKTVTSMLHERAHLLTRALALMAEHEGTGARALGAVPQQGSAL
jgi:WXG100 family type VII secretion target